MKCDELRIENACVYGPDAKVYLAEQVDEAIYDGRFFKVNGLDEKDFVFSGEEKPTKDGNYMCICQHGRRYTIEQHSFYAKVMDNGKERRDDQWGFNCEHIPIGYGHSYPVIAWSRSSYKPFKEEKRWLELAEKFKEDK